MTQKVRKTICHSRFCKVFCFFKFLRGSRFATLSQLEQAMLDQTSLKLAANSLIFILQLGSCIHYCIGMLDLIHFFEEALSLFCSTREHIRHAR